MKTFLFIMAPLIIALTASAQPDTLWTAVVGTDSTNEYIRSMHCTPDGGFIVAGTMECDLVYHWMLIKLTVNGDVAWSRTYGNESNALSHVFAYPAPDDGYYLVREEYGDWCLTRVDASGDSLWSHFYGTIEPDGFSAAAPAADGGCLLAGVTQNSIEEPSAYYVRLDAGGDTLWTRTYGQVGENWPLTCIEAVNGGWWVSLRHTAWPMPDGSFLRLSENGDSLWSRFNDRATYTTMIRLSGGGLAMAGDDNTLDRTIIRVDEAGVILWSRNYYVPDMYGPPQVLAEDFEASQPRILSAICGCHAEMPQLGMLAIDLNGDTVWTQRYGPDLGFAELHSTCARPDDGGYLLAGVTYGGPELWGDLYFARIGPLVISADKHTSTVPADINLSCYPNPFNPATTLSLDLPISARVSLVVHDVLGQTVQTIADQWLSAGTHSFTFDASALPSGIYFARVQAGDFAETRKLLLLK